MAGLYERDAQAISRLSHLRFFPQAIVGGTGSWLRSDDGRDLLDFSASWGAASLGHAHPAIRRSVDAALTDQAGASLLSTATEPAVHLAERLLGLVPERAHGRVWLGHSGSDANETVARAVVAATRRSRIIAFEGAYHGGTAGSVAISGHPVQDAALRFPGLSLIPYPDPYRDGGPERAAARSLDALEQLLGEIDPRDVAAFFLEPIQSDGGMIVPPEGFFREVEHLCRRHGILLVSDEVKVGLGRSGRLHCFEHLGIEPDIVVFGKGLGSGLPISAAVGPEAVMNHATAFSFQTLHGNPVCCAAALAVLDTIEAEGLAANATRVGGHFAHALKGLAARHSLIGDVRGHGLALGVELVVDREMRTPAPHETAMSVLRAHELGLVLYPVGVNGNVVEVTPPLVLTKEEADIGISVLDRALEDVAEGRISPDAVAEFRGWQ